MKRIQLLRIGASVLVAAALVLASCGGKGNSGGSGDSASGGGAPAAEKKGGGAKAEEKAAADLLAVLDGGDVEAIGKALSTANAAMWSTLARVSGAPGGDFSYDLNTEGNGIVINKYSGKGGVVVIPATIEDIPVVTIAGNAFAGTYFFDGDRRGGQGDMITSVIIPAGVQSIGYSAFLGCEQLTSVILPDTLKYISYNAFKGCSNLHTVNIPAGVGIGYEAFKGCGNLYNLTLPEGKLLFYYTLIDKEMPNNSAFNGCQKLKLTTRQKLKDLGYGGDF